MKGSWQEKSLNSLMGISGEINFLSLTWDFQNLAVLLKSARCFNLHKFLYKLDLSYIIYKWVYLNEDHKFFRRTK